MNVISECVGRLDREGFSSCSRVPLTTLSIHNFKHPVKVASDVISETEEIFRVSWLVASLYQQIFKTTSLSCEVAGIEEVGVGCVEAAGSCTSAGYWATGQSKQSTSAFHPSLFSPTQEREVGEN